MTYLPLAAKTEDIIEAVLVSGFSITVGFLVLALAVAWLILPFLLLGRMARLQKAIEGLRLAQSNNIGVLKSIEGASKEGALSLASIQASAKRSAELAEWTAQHTAGNQ